FHKARAAAGNVDQFADQVCVDPVGEVFQVQVQVIHIGGQFGCKVVAQIFRVQVFQIGAGLDEGAPGLGHFLAVDRYKTMGIDGSGSAEAGALEQGRPEQGVEVDDVLADKVIELGFGVGVPVLVKVEVGAAAAQVFEAGHVTNRCIQPDIKILARSVGNFKPEIGRVTADIPLLQAGVQPFGQFVGDLGLQGAAAGPLLQELGELRQ